MADNDFDRTVKLPSGTPPADKTGQIPAADQTMKLAPDPDKTMKLSSSPAPAPAAAPAQPAVALPPPPPAPEKPKKRLAWVLILVLVLALGGAWFVAPSILMKRASSQSAAGDHARAAKTLRTVLLLHPRKPQAYSVALGHELNLGSDFTQAQTVLEPVVEKDPGDLAALRELSQSYLGAGQQQKAFRSLQTFTQKRPDDWEALKWFAQVAFDLKDYPAAATAYEKLVDSGAADPGDWYKMGQVFAEVGKWPQAENALAIAAEKAAKPQGWNRLMARVLTEEGKFVEAVPLYREEIQTAPSDAALAQAYAETCQKAAESLVLQGKVDDAIALLNEGLTVPSTKAPELHYRLATLLAARPRKMRETLGHLAQAVKADPALKAQAAKDSAFVRIRRFASFRRIIR